MNIIIKKQPWWMTGGITATPIGVWKPKGAVSLAASYVNLAKPGNPDITEGSAPTWDNVSGWVFNGTSYLISNIYPLSDASMTIACRFSDATGTSNHGIFGSGNNSSPYNGCMFQHSLSNNKKQYSNDGLSSASGRYTSGVACVNGRAGYMNGILDVGPWTDSAQAMPTDHLIYIGGLDLDGSVAQRAACKIQAIAIYSGTLTADQVKALYVTMARL